MPKVLKTFKCKEQNKVFRPGMEYKASKTRLEKLAELGYIEKTTEAKE